jgi:hypothetical protein
MGQAQRHRQIGTCKIGQAEYIGQGEQERQKRKAEKDRENRTLST